MPQGTWLMGGFICSGSPTALQRLSSQFLHYYLFKTLFNWCTLLWQVFIIVNSYAMVGMLYSAKFLMVMKSCQFSRFGLHRWKLSMLTICSQCTSYSVVSSMKIASTKPFRSSIHENLLPQTFSAKVRPHCVYRNFISKSLSSLCISSYDCSTYHCLQFYTISQRLLKVWEELPPGIQITLQWNLNKILVSSVQPDFTW